MFKKSISSRGLFPTVVYAVQWPFIVFFERERLRKRNAIQAEYDKINGTDTAGIIPLSSFVIDDADWAHGVRYAPTSNEDFLASLSLLGLPIDSYKNYNFVDIGSGKGATLLYATDLGFKSIIGVELVKELHEIAQDNLLRHPMARTVAKSVCTNAVNFQMPDGPLVVFANYPTSSREIMNEIVKQIVHCNGTPKFLIAANFPYDPSTLAAGTFQLIDRAITINGNTTYAFQTIVSCARRASTISSGCNPCLFFGPHILS